MSLTPPPQIDGLSSADAAQRLRDNGSNSLPNDQRRTLRRILGEALREPMFLLLLAAGVIYLLLGDPIEGATLFGAVLLTLAMTLYQEGKTERAIAALHDLTSPQARVIRDGTTQHIAAREVVVGDIMLLAEGDRVPADAELLEGTDLQADESLLTGEPVPVRKVPRAPDATEDATAPARAGGDDLPFVFSGTLIVQGQGTARVTATGAQSSIGRIGTSLTSIASDHCHFRCFWRLSPWRRSVRSGLKLCGDFSRRYERGDPQPTSERLQMDVRERFLPRLDIGKLMADRLPRG